MFNKTMTQHLDWLDCGEIEARQLTPAEIKAQLAQWKAQKSDIGIPITEEQDDTQPLSHAEIVYKQLEGRCIALMDGEKMTAGKLCDQKEFKVIQAWVKSQIGEVGAGELFSDFFVTHNHLFT